MNPGLRWGVVAPAGVCWIFVARLAGDLASGHFLTPPLMTPLVVVIAFLLPLRPGAMILAFLLLLYDSGGGAPFGLTASLALPAHWFVSRLRDEIDGTPAVMAAFAVALTAPSHIATALVMKIAGRPFPVETELFIIEILIGAVVSGFGTLWLANAMRVSLRLSGVTPVSRRDGR